MRSDSVPFPGVGWMDRRGFLVRTGLGLAATALASGGLDHRTALSQSDLDDWAAIRALFNLSPTLLHFGGLLLASHPAPVRDAIDAHRRGLDDNPVDYLHQNQARLEADVLRAASAYLGGAAPADIALTDSTTMGLGLLYNGLAVRPDQEVLTTAHDFYSTHEALVFKAQRSGATLKAVRLYTAPESTSRDEIVSSL